MGLSTDPCDTPYLMVPQLETLFRVNLSLSNTGFSKSKNMPPTLLFKAFKILFII